jgi:hypothetical protein
VVFAEDEVGAPRWLGIARQFVCIGLTLWIALLESGPPAINHHGNDGICHDPCG